MAKLRRHDKFCRNRSNHGQDMAIFLFFQDGGRPPSSICDACVRTTHEGHLVVFITVQNLIALDTVVSIVCNFTISRLRLENIYSRPQNCFFWGSDTLNGELCHCDPQKALSCMETPHMTYRSSKSVQHCGLGVIPRIK